MHDPGTLVLMGMEQGAIDGLVILGWFALALLVGFFIALFFVIRIDAKRRRAELARRRVRTFIEINGEPVAFDMKEAA